MPEDRSPRLAVLIDADNASSQIADGLFDEIAKLGEASVRRIYGDFASQRMKGWTSVLSRHAIIPQQQFAYTTGKNASDITLVIDAMDLLHSGRFDGFCLVSSDSDFTRLAARIREQGVDVYGFGEQKTPESFRQACRRFIYTENLLPGAQMPDVNKAAASSLQPPTAAVPNLRKVITQMDGEEGWVSLSEFGKRLNNLFSDFDPRTYGQKKLSDLVRATGAFDVEKIEGGGLRSTSQDHATAENALPLTRLRLTPPAVPSGCACPARATCRESPTARRAPAGRSGTSPPCARTAIAPWATRSAPRRAQSSGRPSRR